MFDRGAPRSWAAVAKNPFGLTPRQYREERWTVKENKESARCAETEQQTCHILQKRDVAELRSLRLTFHFFPFRLGYWLFPFFLGIDGVEHEMVEAMPAIVVVFAEIEIDVRALG
jgi:hypothetical protein